MAAAAVETVMVAAEAECLAAVHVVEAAAEEDSSSFSGRQALREACLSSSLFYTEKD